MEGNRKKNQKSMKHQLPTRLEKNQNRFSRFRDAYFAYLERVTLG